MHCFSGNVEMAKKYIEHGFYISFTGNVTYPNASRLSEVVRTIDLDKVLLETDCPWLAPQTMRGKRNEPAFLPLIAAKIAELRRVSLDEVAEKTTENARRAYQIP